MNSENEMTAFEAYELAKESLEKAQEAYDSCECEDTQNCEHSRAVDNANKACDEARENYLESDEERTWEIREAGNSWGHTYEAVTVDEALSEAAGNMNYSDYVSSCDNDVNRGTIFCTIYAYCEETGEEGSTTVALEPEEPECEKTNHDWQSPYDLLGGLEENPGVWGKGGGVIIREVCMHCGCERVTDTWAQNPETGEQGLKSVSYEPGKYTDEITKKRRVELLSEAAKKLSEAGYDTTEETDEHLIIALPSNTPEEGDEAIEDLRNLLGDNYLVNWTGNGNTDSYGDTSDDVCVEVDI
jgi:hypothetical protein